MFERFSERSRKAMMMANMEAKRLRHTHVDTQHVLLGLLLERSGVGANILANIGLDYEKARAVVERLTGPGTETVSAERLPQTAQTKELIQFAIEESHLLNHRYVGTEHLLLGLTRNVDSWAYRVLVALGQTSEQLRREAFNLIGVAPGDWARDATATLEQLRISLKVVHDLTDQQIEWMTVHEIRELLAKP